MARLGLYQRRINDQVIDRVRTGSEGTAQISDWTKRAVFIALGLISLLFLWDQLLEIFSSAPRLRSVDIRWFGVALVLEAVSFGCTWWLTRIVLPKVSWFVAATSQLVSNAVSRSVPGGVAASGATLYRMLSVSGVAPAEAAGALAATSILSTAALFAIPATALLLALVGAPIPEQLWPAAVAGGVMFVALVATGLVGLRSDRPLLLIGRLVDKIYLVLNGRFGRPKSFDPYKLVVERDRLGGVLENKGPQAVAAVAGNWAFDYLALIAALYGVGAHPRLSIVLLAYAGGSVLGMIPFTPGGVGFVDAGLYSLLIISGISAQDAVLATVVYRIVSLLFPLLSGLVAWRAYRRRYRPSQVQTIPTGPVISTGETQGRSRADS